MQGAGELELHDRAVDRDADGVAELEAALLGGPGVQGDLAGGARAPAVGQREARVGAVGARDVVGAGGGEAVADQRALAVGDAGEAADHTAGLGGAGQRGDGLAGVLGELGAVGALAAVVVPLADGTVVADGDGDVGVALGALGAPGAGEGVGEDHGAGHEGGAEEDGERRHQQSGLVGQHIAQCGAVHGVVSVLRVVASAAGSVTGRGADLLRQLVRPLASKRRMRSRTVSAVGLVSSSTMRPSARKTTRSA